jgi:hypothetical protein
VKDIKRIMRRAGRYYEAGQFLYHKFLRNELVQMGFRVVLIEKLDHHPVWHIRLRITARAQNFLLLSRPLAKRLKAEDDSTDLLVIQLKAEIKRIAAQLGPKIKSDYISILREGAYITVAFIWPVGTTGLLLRKQRRPDAFGLLVRPWLKTTRN